MKHTATPWYQNEDGDVCAKVEGIESVIADCLTHASIGRHNYKENAELIVRAVNSHDKLVTALEGMIDRYTGLVNCGDCGNWNPEEEKSVIAAREALAAAKGE